MPTLPDLGVPAIAGRAIPNCIAAACVKAAFPGNYATFSARAQDERSRIARKVRELAGLPQYGESFVDFAIVRDSDGTPRIIFGDHAWDHIITREAAAQFEATAIKHGLRQARAQIAQFSQLAVD